FCGRIEAAQVSHCINNHLGACRSQPIADLPVTIPHRSGEKRPARAARIFRERRQPFAAGDNFLGANDRVSGCGHGLLTLAADARFNVAVRLVDGTKISLGLSCPERERSTSRQCLFGIVSSMSVISGTLARAASPMAYKVCCTDLLVCPANTFSRISRILDRKATKEALGDA